MLATVLLCLVAGFFVGNGLPYYVAGSTGQAISPSPFPQRPATNVLVGCAAMALGGLLWSLAHVADHRLAAWLGALAGVLIVGLIHSRTWRNNPWHRRAAAGR